MNINEYLDAVVEELQQNVNEYEMFHDKKLLDIRKMEPFDSFLYGIATGKLAVAKDLRDLIKELMDRFDS